MISWVRTIIFEYSLPSVFDFVYDSLSVQPMTQVHYGTFGFLGTYYTYKGTHCGRGANNLNIQSILLLLRPRGFSHCKRHNAL